MRKNTLIIILFFAEVFIARAQVTLSPSVINSAAGHGTSGTMSIYYSIGEPIIATGTDGNKKYYTQGFLQPNSSAKTDSLNVYADTVNVTCSGANDGKIILHINGVQGKLGVVWQDISLPLTVRTNLAPGSYSVNIYDTLPNRIVSYNHGNPLVYTIKESTTLCPVTIYNSFSPNGDGKNEVFYLEDINKYPENKVQIFNRWGVQIWSGNNYDNINTVWDGKDQKGNLVVDGTYYYFINLKDGKTKTEKTYKGWIEITK